MQGKCQQKLFKHQWFLLFWYQSIRIFYKHFERLECSFWSITCIYIMGDCFHFFCVMLVCSYGKVIWRYNSTENGTVLIIKKNKQNPNKQLNMTNFYKSLFYKITTISIVIFNAILWQHINFLITWRVYPNTTCAHYQ